MKSSVKRLARMAVLLSFLPACANAETLQDAVQSVVQRHPDIRSAAHNRLARDKEVVQARSGYFPQLNVEAGAGYDDVKKPIDDELSPWEARISLRQNLFAGFSTMNEVERQKARVKSQAFLTQSTAENTALETIKTYLEVLKNIHKYDRSVSKQTTAANFSASRNRRRTGQLPVDCKFTGTCWCCLDSCQ